MSVAEQSRESIIGELREEDSRDTNSSAELPRSSTKNLEKYFMSGSPLCPEELLIYTLMKIEFKTSTFTKHHSIVKYKRISKVVSKVCGVRFNPSVIRRFFPRISNNEMKATVGKQNGEVRWSFFSGKIDELLRTMGKELEKILECAEIIPEDVVVSICDQLKRLCSLDWETSKKLSEETVVNEFNNSSVVKCIPWFNAVKREFSVFSFGCSPGYAEKEVRLFPKIQWKWKLYVKGLERDLSNSTILRDFHQNIETMDELVRLLGVIDCCDICEWCGDTERCRLLVELPEDDCFYRTKEGKAQLTLKTIWSDRQAVLFL